ncbi:MAG: winged helix-turn-helix transcriptional regulator [Desulfobacteraceae bacterium]|jgi:DNA-binding MarR family transcriptional regulator
MDNRDVKTLQILEAIADNDGVSQRSLAQKLNVSLGLVNSFVKHLTAKGYFRAKALPKDRVRYILTPEGVAEKTRLAYDYIKYSFDLYKKSYGIIHDMLKNLASEGVETVVLYGVSVISEMIFQEVSKLGIEIAVVIDDANKGKIFHGKTAIGLDEVEDVKFDKIIVTACDNQQYSVESLLKAGVSQDIIVTLDHKKYV